MANEKIPVSLYGVNHSFLLGAVPTAEFQAEVGSKKFIAIEALGNTEPSRKSYQRAVDGEARVAPPTEGMDETYINIADRVRLLEGTKKTLLFPDLPFRKSTGYNDEIKAIILGKDFLIVGIINSGIQVQDLKSKLNSLSIFASREGEAHKEREKFKANALAGDKKLTKIKEANRPENSVSMIEGAIHLPGLKKELAEHGDMFTITHTQYESGVALSPYDGMVLLYRMGKEHKITPRLQMQALVSEAVQKMISYSLTATNNAPREVSEDFAVKKVAKIIATSLSNDEMIAFLSPDGQERFAKLFISRILNRMETIPFYEKGLRRKENSSLAYSFQTIARSLEQYQTNF